MEIRWPSLDQCREKIANSNLGWLLGLFGLVWTLLGWKGQVEEAVNTAHQLFPFLSVALTFVGSTWFGIALMMAGLVYVIFVPAERHPSSSAIATAAAIGACMLSFAALFFVTALIFANRLSRQPGPGQAWQWPRLTNGQKESLSKSFRRIGNQAFSIECTCSDCCSLGSDLADVALTAGWPPPSIGPGGIDSIGASGIAIGCGRSEVTAAFAMSAALKKALGVDAPVFPSLGSGIALTIGLDIPSPQQASGFAGAGRAPPASGHGYKLGDRWRNTSPSPGGNEGWICAAPQGGSGDCIWVEFGPISL